MEFLLFLWYFKIYFSYYLLAPLYVGSVPHFVQGFVLQPTGCLTSALFRNKFFLMMRVVFNRNTANNHDSTMMSVDTLRNVDQSVDLLFKIEAIFYWYSVMLRFGSQNTKPVI